MSEDGHLIREDPSLKSVLSWLKNSRKRWKRVTLDLMVSTRPVQHLVRNHGPLLFFGLSSVVYWVTRRLRSSFSPALRPLTQVLPPPTQILAPPSPPSSSSSIHPQRRPRRDWEAQHDLYLSTGGRGCYIVLVGIGACAVMLKMPVRRLTGLGMLRWLASRGSVYLEITA